MENAMFGAGCFWGVEEAFRTLPGVLETAVGYSGGKKENPTYEEVCTDETGHAEVVWLKFDPKIISYEALINVFWETHDPTTKNRQGLDIGSQYRSAIYYYNDSQKEIAEKAKVQKTHAYSRPIVTEISPAETFYRGEEYHQKYIQKRGGGIRCH